MSYFDRYKIRVKSDGGDGIGEAFKNDTIAFINESFKDDPFYKIVKIDGTDTETRIVEGNDSKNRILLFRPQTVKPFGGLVELDSGYWLIFDFVSNEIYPKAHIKQCNTTLKWRDRNGVSYSYNAIVSTANQFYMGLSNPNGIQSIDIDSGVFVFVNSNVNTNTLTYGQRFIVNGQVYEISGIDNVSNSGITKYTMKFANKNEADDFINGIADNSVLYGGSGAGAPPVDEDNVEGGGLW